MTQLGRKTVVNPIHERIFVARGALALAFAVGDFVALAVAPRQAVRIFGIFLILDGLLALVSAYSVREAWSGLRRSALTAEGVVEFAFGLFILTGPYDAPVVAFAIAVNAILGGVLASVYSYIDKNENEAAWWAIYAITGVILGFVAPVLLSGGIPEMLLAVGIVVAIQGIARIALRGSSSFTV